MYLGVNNIFRCFRCLYMYLGVKNYLKSIFSCFYKYLGIQIIGLVFWKLFFTSRSIRGTRSRPTYRCTTICFRSLSGVKCRADKVLCMIAHCKRNCTRVANRNHKQLSKNREEIIIATCQCCQVLIDLNIAK
jgi:hypothetical protein